MDILYSLLHGLEVNLTLSIWCISHLIALVNTLLYDFAVFLLCGLYCISYLLLVPGFFAGALAMESLHRQVLPFLLRRLKEDVLQDLPPKIIQDYYCDLSPLQVSGNVSEM